MLKRLLVAVSAAALVLGFAVPAKAATVYYSYSGTKMQLAGTAQGMQANLHVKLAYVAPADYHSLSELAVINDNTLPQAQRNIVEVGTITSNSVCGAGNSPCLFTGIWVNGVFQGYNTGLVAYAPTCSVPANYCAGDTLAPHITNALNGTPMQFIIQHSGGNWWVGANGMWIGAFPDSLWGGAFTAAKTFRPFQEVAASTVNTCSDMGNGLLGTDPSGLAARLGSAILIGDVPAVADNFVANTVTAPYDLNVISTQTSRAGGPGSGGVRDGC